MKKILFFVIISIILIGGLSIWILRDGNTLSGTSRETPSIADVHSMYASGRYGVAFAYPTSYRIEEREVEGSAQREEHIITLIRESDLPIPSQGEGPPAITIQIFQNDLDAHTAENWIRTVSNSNFKLSSDGRLASTSVGGDAALGYRWDGLYRGETVVTARPTYVYAFSVTYADAQDTIRTDFDTILRSVVFQ